MRMVFPLAAVLALLSGCTPALRPGTETEPLYSPLAPGQVWNVRAYSVAISREVQVRVETVRENSPGLYSNLTDEALSDARRGRPAPGQTLQPAVTLQRLSREMNFYWSETGTDYRCTLQRTSAETAGRSTVGTLSVSGTPLGNCEVRLLSTPPA